VNFLDLTLSTPEENLALDEALLLAAEADGAAEYLRVWESPQYFVVLGKNCRIAHDVWVENCQLDGVPVLRRISGGGTVLLGPACLNYTLVLRLDHSPELRAVSASFDYILDCAFQTVRATHESVARAGQSDLVLSGRKFCGNAQRRQRTHVLHHGSILYAFHLEKIPRYLKEPSRQPDYRGRRSHLEFLANLAVAPEQLRVGFRSAWNATSDAKSVPHEVIKKLVGERYGQREWIFRR